MLAHYTMEPGETIMKTAWWNEAAALWWELHCVESPSIFCPLSASCRCLATQLFAHGPAGYLQANSPPQCLETSHRHPLVCRVPLRSARCSESRPKWRGAQGPPETGFPCVVLCSRRRPSVPERSKIFGEEKIFRWDWQQSLRCHGVTSRRIVTQLASSRSKVLIRGNDNEGYFGIRSHFTKP